MGGPCRAGPVVIRVAFRRTAPGPPASGGQRPRIAIAATKMITYVGGRAIWGPSYPQIAPRHRSNTAPREANRPFPADFADKQSGMSGSPDGAQAVMTNTMERR